MTAVCDWCDRVYLEEDPDSRVCRTRHENDYGGSFTCRKKFCSGDCYERHLMEEENR